MLNGLKNLRHMNPIEISEKLASQLPGAVPKEGIRRRLLDVLLNFGIPFNRWLGLRIREFGTDHVVIESPPTTLRKNHVGSAHACALALIGEYAAGLLIAQHFPIDTHRFIIGRLDIEYKKQGRGTLSGVAQAPVEWPELQDGEAWISMQTEITDEKNETVAVCKTEWQVKSWAKVDSRKS